MPQRDDTRLNGREADASRLLYRVGRSSGRWGLAFGLTSVVLACAETAFPAVLGRAVDAVVGAGAPRSWIVWAALLLAAIALVDVFDDIAVGEALARSTAWARHALLRHVLALGPRVQRFGAGDVTSRLVANAADAGRVVPNAVRAVTGLIPAVGGLVALALIDPWLCLTFAAGLPVLALLVRAFVRDASTVTSGYLATQGTIAGRLVDALSGARTIAAAGTVEKEARRVLEPLPDLHRDGVGLWRAQRRIATRDAVLVPLLVVAVLAVAGAELSSGRITPGQLLAAAEYVVLASGLSGLATWAAQFIHSRAGAARVAVVMDTEPIGYGSATLPTGRGRLEYRGVAVRGPSGEQVLEGVDLEIPPGALAGVVGRSGAGKSVLVALAGRLIDPTEGEVLLDGVALRELDRVELREAVGYAFERPALIGATVEDAIGFGARSATTDEVVSAARDARADDFIRRMRSGYATALADAPMSGGEAQRIGLARAFAHAGRVLILDDVAASLDTVTEHHISEALTSTHSDRTRIVTAHRVSTASRADFVIWLDGGTVRASAPHHELWQDADYRALFEPAGPLLESQNGSGRP